MKLDAVNAFRSLAHETRLTIFRLLIKSGANGMPAGQIALKLKIPASTLSAHLHQLEQAGLLISRREQQRIHYGINLDGTQSLIQFLLQDCCSGKPELCGYSIKPITQKTKKA